MGRRALEINGTRYVSAASLVREVGITRQTLWRWRREKKVPAGTRYRGLMVIFTEAEVETIRSYAHRMELATPSRGRRKGDRR